MRTADQVSVVIPTYNRAPLLRQALESVSGQTAPVGEVIVVDDGSTDGTEDVVEEFRGRSAKLALVTLAHTNDLGRIRNSGIQRASGTIIALLDSDDLWMPDRIEHQLAHWNENPGAGIAFCNVRRFDDSGPFPGGPWLDPSLDFTGRVLADLLLEPVALPSALMFDREVYAAVGPYRHRPVNEDYEWLLEAAVRVEADYVSEPLVMMRSHDANRSREKSLQASTEYLAIIREFLAAHPELTPAERRSARLGMANVHVKISRHMLQSGKPGSAARAATGAMRLHPTDRRAYSLLLASIAARATTRSEKGR